MPQNDPFDRFTERARKVLELAQDEAKRFNHNYIGTEHLLLGLVADGEGVGAKVLINLGVDLAKVRGAVEFIIGRGERQVMGEIGLTPRAKKVIELARDEAQLLGHGFIGTEHLLLGMIREGEGIAAGILESLGVNLETVRSEVLRVLSGTGEAAEPLARDTALEPDGEVHQDVRSWEYLVLPTVQHEGLPYALPFFAEHEEMQDLSGLQLPDALQRLSSAGWELAGVDSIHQTDEGPGALYVFKRPK